MRFTTLGIAIVAAVGWLLFGRERARCRAYATDLALLVHDHDLSRDDLPRSREWPTGIDERVRYDRRS